MTVRLRNISPVGALDVVALGRTVYGGEEFDCPDDVAGRAPGTWREPTAAELADGMRGLARRVVDGRVEVLCPGRGLLGQPANFETVDGYSAVEIAKSLAAGVAARNKAAKAVKDAAGATVEEK